MSRKFTLKVTPEQLACQIVNALVVHENFENDDIAKTATAIDFMNRHEVACQGGLLKHLTPNVEKDLNKVNFDTENTEYKEGEGYNEGITGFRTLPNGLTILGVTAGGDWESPLYYIIYYDGKGLRGYIPTKGNPWNTITKAAYGNDEEETGGDDEKDCLKRFGKKNYSEVEINQAEVDQDIQDRIVFDTTANPGMGYSSLKTLADIDSFQGKPDKMSLDGVLYDVGNGYGVIDFFCAPNRGGCMDDDPPRSFNTKLRTMFNDIDIEVGASEAHHIVKSMPVGMTKDSLWAMIEGRLIAAGAVKPSKNGFVKPSKNGFVKPEDKVESTYHADADKEDSAGRIIIENFLANSFSIDNDVDDIDIWMQATRDKIIGLKGKKPSDAYVSLVALVNGDMRSLMEKVMRLMSKVSAEDRKKS